MTQITYLSKAPIIEALIDIRIDPAIKFSEAKLTRLKDILGNDYPTVEPRHLSRIEFMVMPSEKRVATKPSEDPGLQGYFFKSEDKRNIAQFRIDGFTLNRLKPYSSWDNISDEAKRLWNIYCDVLSPDYVTRIAVRYINHMKLSLPTPSIEDYFVITPIIPEGLPDQFSSFLHKVVISDDETEIEANITINLEHNKKAKEGTVIFDIDAYRRVNFPPDTAEIWRIFDELRRMKNRIFFGYITEKTVEGFK